MKIAIIVRILWPGGVQRIAFAEAEGLSKLGNEVDLIFIRATDRFIYSSKVNYRIMYDSSINKRFLGKILKKITLHYSPQRGEDATVDIDLIYKTEHKLNKKYDIIYYFDEFAAFFQNYNKKKFGNKTAVLIFEVALMEGSYLSKYIQRRAIKNADIVLTITNENLQSLEKAGVKNAYLIYPGLVLNDNIPKFDERENIAISVTMWDSGRKPEVLIEIGKRIKNGKLIIAGSWADNNYFNNIKKMIVENNLQDKVIVTGQIDENSLIELYKKSKVSIRFGYNEKGPGMGSLEAISWGLPLIINEGIGIRDLIKDSINGYIVNETDYDKIAQLIDDLFTDKNKWSMISYNNIQLAKDLSWENHCKLLDSIFKKIL